MPVRVKCRCGQETILRYGEWVYVLVGAVVVAFAVNLVAVILLYSRLQSLEARLEHSPTTARGEAPSQPDRPPAKTGVDATEARSAAPAKADVSAAPPKLPDIAASPGGIAPADVPVAVAGEDLLEDLKRQASLAATADESEALPAERMPLGYRSLLPAPAFLRLLFLRQVSANAQVYAAALLDPEAQVRRAAAELFLEHSLAKISPSSARATDPDGASQQPRDWPLIRPLLQAARPDLESRADGRDLFERLPHWATSELAGADATHWPEVEWSVAKTTAEGLLAASPDLVHLRGRLEAIGEDGLDILLAVDTTKSMEAALVEFKEATRWLLPGLCWAAPGTRIGVLFYKDDVTGAVDLSDTPGRDLLPRILEIRAEGGGDVPEGVHVALRAALELGRIRWRPRALKHIVFVGDAPPPFSELRSLKSLASACHTEAGFRVHAIGVQPRESLPLVPFFAEIAEEGGGRSSTSRPGLLAQEIMACLYGDTDERLRTRSLAILKARFLDG